MYCLIGVVICFSYWLYFIYLFYLLLLLSYSGPLFTAEGVVLVNKFGEWVGVDRRLLRDRRVLGDRREMIRFADDRRSGRGRRAADTQPFVFRWKKSPQTWAQDIA